MTREAISFCRACGAACGVRLTLDEDDHIVDIRGDKANPLSKGYMCFKGLQAEEAHHGSARLLRPLKRLSNGQFAEVSLDAALEEIAERLGAIIARHGGNAVAVMAGGGSFLTASSHVMYRDFLRAINSDQNFTTATIDQSAKIVSFERMGGWAAGTPDLDQCDVVLLIGTNPLVAHTTVGLMTTNPTRRIKEAIARGLKLICIDPRKSEVTKYADLVLQPLPGQDAAILAGMLRIILNEGWHDADFCERYVAKDGLRALKEAVSAFAEEMVERRAGLNPGQIRAAASLFARDHKRGAAFTGTGPNMGSFSNLTQHFADCLNIVCGRLRRAGERAVVNPRDAVRPIRAEVIPPPRSWAHQVPSRTRGVRQLIGGERLTGTLADEILTPGDGQIRALIVDGSNTAQNIPGQRHVIEALKSLELLVVIDPVMSVTSRLAHFVIPPKMPYERADLPIYAPGFPLQHDSGSQFTSPVFAPPPGSEVIDGWRFYWELASRLDLQIIYNGKQPLDMANPPTTEKLFELLLCDAAITLEEIKRYPSGKIFDFPHARVLPANPNHDARFDVMPDDVAAECVELRDANPPLSGNSCNGRPFTHLLASRRLSDVHNSLGTTLRGVLRRLPYNPVFLNPDDMHELGLQEGRRVEISSAYGSVIGLVQPDANLRRSVVNLPHGWGGLPDIDDGPGISVNLLTDDKANAQSINAMPLMSSLPVSVVPCDQP